MSPSPAVHAGRRGAERPVFGHAATAWILLLTPLAGCASLVPAPVAPVPDGAHGSDAARDARAVADATVALDALEPVEATRAPDVTAAPDATAAPDGTAAPDVTAAPAPDAGAPPDAGQLDASAAPDAALCITCLSFRVSAPEPYVWPAPAIAGLAPMPDSLFTVVPFPGRFVGYIADLSTYALSGPSLPGLNIVESFGPSPVIGPGDAGQFDECGAWLHGAELDPATGLVRGWYHTESGYCNGVSPDARHPVKSIAYAESANAGLSFDKVGYPNNVVLSGPPEELAQASPAVTPGNGDFSVVQHDGDYYMFFIDAFHG